MRFVLFVGIVQSILFLGHWFLYRTLVRFFGLANPSVLLTMRVGTALLSVSLVATSFLAFRYSNLVVRCLYTGAASWLGIFYFFSIFFLYEKSFSQPGVARRIEQSGKMANQRFIHYNVYTLCGSSSLLASSNPFSSSVTGSSTELWYAFLSWPTHRSF